MINVAYIISLVQLSLTNNLRERSGSAIIFIIDDGWLMIDFIYYASSNDRRSHYEILSKPIYL